jgi:hypothetical protein
MSGILKIMVNDRLIFDELEKRIQEKCVQSGLMTLLEHKIPDKPNTLTECISICSKKKPVRQFDIYGLYQDMNYLSADMRYLIGIISYLQPFINDPVKENGTYIQNIYDRRYFMYVSMAYQMAYIYWDRIGDLLDKYFQTELDERNVTFVSVINNIPDQWKLSSNYQWFAEVLKNDYSEINKARRDIVHYNSPEHRRFMNVIFSRISEDKTKLEKIKREKDNFPELFKNHFGVMLNGFEKALIFIDELPNKENDDIEI